MTLPAESRERLLLALRRTDPDAFRREVRPVLAAHGDACDAARALGVAVEILRRWLADDPALARGLALDD